MMASSESEIIFPKALFDYECFEHKAILEDITYVWEALIQLQGYIATYVAAPHHRKNVDIMQGAVVGTDVVLGADVVIEPHVYIKGPALIGDRTIIRHCAYVRENVIIGKDCVIGNSTEVKNSIVMDGARASHWNYIGDSIIGLKVNLGAGTKLSNSKITDTEIRVHTLDGQTYATGLRKLGAIIGDETQIGCNVVLNPGTILGKGCLVYPLVPIRGTYAHREVIKNMRDV